ncbi:MAG: flagellar hook protein FlgE [Hyphomicrobiales bacterium]
MIASLYAGISGLSANATAMTVIGDNIANVNTTAFKSNRSEFANVLSTALGGESALSKVGRGVDLWSVDARWAQGSLENTSSPTDLAINGQGFFMVKDEDGSNFYTRAGNFHFDKDGYLVNPDGLRLQGYQLDANGLPGIITDVFIPGERVSPPAATTKFTFDMNLDAGAQTGDTYTTSQTVYDSLGNAIPLTFTFTKQAAAGTWTAAAAIPPAFGTGVTLGGAATASFVFNGSGVMTSPASDLAVSLTLTNGATSPLALNWDLYDASNRSLGDISGYAAESNTTFQYQDGYPSGMLRSISVDENGIVTATYSNGEMVPNFQVVLADFQNYDGLTKLGNNLYAESIDSGQALPGMAGNGRLGSISPQCLEMSNVDLAEEFVKMITTQRAFQANSRVITASDEILQELINIKR